MYGSFETRLVLSVILATGAFLIFRIGQRPDLRLWRALDIPVMKWAVLNRILRVGFHFISIALLAAALLVFIPSVGYRSLWLPMVGVPLVLFVYYARMTAFVLTRNWRP